MSYSEKDGKVVLTMARADYELLLMALGCAAGVSLRDGQAADYWFGLVNRLNEGNPHFTPYKITPRSG